MAVKEARKFSLKRVHNKDVAHESNISSELSDDFADIAHLKLV